jgi:hypothetical protein
MFLDPWKTEQKKHEHLQRLINRINLNPDLDNRESAKRDYIDLYQRTQKPAIIEKQNYQRLIQEIEKGELNYNIGG